MKPKSLLFFLCSLFVAFTPMFGQSNRIGLPIIFVHGFCGDAPSFRDTEINVQVYLKRVYPQLYGPSREYFAFFDGNNVQFELPDSGMTSPTIDSSERFFAVAFDDRGKTRVEDFDKFRVAQISIYEKANELAHIIWKIKTLTGAPRVILVAHSMGGLAARAYIEGLDVEPYLNDISTLVTLDTPHGGSWLSWLQTLSLGECAVRYSLNKEEMHPSGGLSVIPKLNYFTSGALPLPPALTVYSIISYWSPPVPFWDTDNILSTDTQDLRSNLNNPQQNVQSILISVANSFDDPFPPSGGDGLCGAPTHPLHGLECTGTAPQTLGQIKLEIRAPAAMTTGVQVSPASATIHTGDLLQLSAVTASGAAAIWSLREGPDAGSISQSGYYQAPNNPQIYHVVAIDSVFTNQYGIATITVNSNDTASVETLAASSITSSAAVMNGTVNPQGARGYAGFYWGTDPFLRTFTLSCGSWNECPEVIPDFTTQPFTFQISGLADNTTYYFRMVFYDTSSQAYIYGSILSFTTLNTGGNEKVLHSFTGGIDGGLPIASLTLQAAKLYGTTQTGGTYGNGTVFQLTPNADGSWTEAVLYNFRGGTDGAIPKAGVVFDGVGNLYGTTAQGGANGVGTAYQLKPQVNGSWTEIVVYNFIESGPEQAGVILDASGNLYGITIGGGDYGYGTVFELVLQSNGSWIPTILHSFTGSDGFAPSASLVFDATGNLYGTASEGGGNEVGGTVFELSPNSDGGWTETTLYSFTDGLDGGFPDTALVLDDGGNLYGTTFFGGASNFGTVFQLSPSGGSWQESVLYSFNGVSDSGPTEAPVTLDGAGNLYGTTGGYDSHGSGAVYELTRTESGWIEGLLHVFTGGSDGGFPVAGVILDHQGNLYGTTDGGGDQGQGVAFEIFRSGRTALFSSIERNQPLRRN